MPPASSLRLLVCAAVRIVAAVIAAVTAPSNQGAIDINIVEHRQSKVVRAGVLSLVKNDRDALHRNCGNGLKRIAVEVRLQRSGGAAPPKPNEADPRSLRC